MSKKLTLENLQQWTKEINRANLKQMLNEYSMLCEINKKTFCE